MRRHRRGGLLVTLGLAAGGVLVATNPGVPALASGQVCAGIVIDDGTGAAALTQGASVPPGSSDLDLLEAAGDSFKQVDSGLVCVINGYPVNGVQNCLEADHGLFYYWSYWEGDATTNTWTYANVGPAEHTVDAGQSYVEGWRYQDPGPDTPAAAKPSETPAAAFAQACQSAPPTTTTTTTTTPGGRRGGRHPGATSAAPLPAPPTTATRATGPGKPSRTSGGQAATTSTTTTQARSGQGAGALSISTTSTSTTQNRQKPKSSSELALARPAGHGASGADSALPVIGVAVIVAMLGVLAWLWWRRRPAEE